MADPVNGEVLREWIKRLPPVMARQTEQIERMLRPPMLARATVGIGPHGHGILPGKMTYVRDTAGPVYTLRPEWPMLSEVEEKYRAELVKIYDAASAVVGLGGRHITLEQQRAMEAAKVAAVLSLDPAPYAGPPVAPYEPPSSTIAHDFADIARRLRAISPGLMLDVRRDA